MVKKDLYTQYKHKAILDLAQNACERIAPLWPLESYVAVNPFMGLSDKSFDEAAKELGYLGDLKLTMNSDFYFEAFRNGEIEIEDLEFAFDKHNYEGDFTSVFNSANDSSEKRLKNILDIAEECEDRDIQSIILDNLSSFLSAFLDEHQALWKTGKADNLYEAWKLEASTNRSYEILGINDFRNSIKSLPTDAQETIVYCLSELKLSEKGITNYLHSLMLRFGGWSAYIAQQDWNANLYGGDKNHLENLVAVYLSIELAIKKAFDSHKLDYLWQEEKEKFASLDQYQISTELHHKIILQEAYDHANERKLRKVINGKQNSVNFGRADIQAVFCIDVRSEVFRRNLESCSDKIETLGFAGFFGFPVKYFPLAEEKANNQCPVLIPSSFEVKEGHDNPDTEQALHERKLSNNQFIKLWKSFKKGAVSCFAYVSPLGIYYLPKLIADSFGWSNPSKHPDQLLGVIKNEKGLKPILRRGEWVSNETLKERIAIARSALSAMSLRSNFARIVLINGHGSTSVNNPHAAGLDCGACGGKSGAVNARVAASVLNDPAVKHALKLEGIEIPADTLFIPALHDTGSDEISLYWDDEISPDRISEIEHLKKVLKEAAEKTRMERGMRMYLEGSDADKSIFRRINDWSQTRPEWGLAGCNSFVIAPRNRTIGKNLSGKSFLHNYTWQEDEDFKVLEAIMTAPMLVTSWINLQYFASTVDPVKLGAGNKTIHNVVGCFGIIEGYSGDLKTGLAWQSVHDGENYQHLPQKLQVIIEAPINVISGIIEKHESIRNLLDNNWIKLLAISNEGKIAYRYEGNLKWKQVEKERVSISRELQKVHH